jgi:Flp pilus assembly pilin Flp
VLKAKRIIVVKLLTRQQGQSLSEYALILALIAIVCLFPLTGLGVGVEKTLGALIAGIRNSPPDVNGSPTDP